MSHSAFDSSTSSSTESLLRSGDRSTASTSPPTSVDYSYDNRSSKHRAYAEPIRLPRIEVPGEFAPPPHRGLQGHKVLGGNRIASSPSPIGMRSAEHLPPSATGFFPPGQWDRSGASLDPNDYSRRSSSSSSDSTYPYDRSMPYGDANMAKRNVKDNGSGAITVGGKKRYPCQHPGCDKTFSTSGHAARHNRIHTGQKPYRCTFPGCKARFSRQDNSLQHYRTHILHPKGRASQSAQARDAAAQLELDHLDLDAADAEAEAKAELGRRALEDGTAIAVVHDVKDQHGRKKGETIERMVGMPRGQRDSLRGGLDDEGSASPSSIDDAHMKRESSLPGVGLEMGQYEAPADYWSTQMAKQGRLSLSQASGAGVVNYDPRYRDPAPPAPYANGNGGMYAGGVVPPAAWSQSQVPYIDPRFAPGYPRSTVSVSPHRANVYDPSSRLGSASLDPELAGLDPSLDYHRRSASTSSSQRDRVPPSVATLPPPGPATRLPLSGAHAASAPVSVVPSARSSQSPKSSPTSSAYSVPEGTSALDKLSAAAASSSPAALSTRGRLNGAPASSAGYQHPYSSDRSTNYASSSLPPISSARSSSGGEDVMDLDRKTMSSSLRSGLAPDSKATLPPLNTPAARRW
ncbi:Zinc finger C2H2-type/integrase DNA-binding domain protein [Kalmanozyma brasiliensis GHG001]|uniref:C2H2-type domain-containing protein n=1 Tax=Kalmanozyma brasiliensis (strain GHG001) TaxID=1365824 RepID=V5GJM9_KALBG|nr:Zinc finger C2H2-type/integrase DNA-binding domain protein [Kalmanozyma brasiliensis GHG001]EST06162.1 Zinc finger C2H2-type/integrase DNA-binding domain protein [Kalmanozyma brasiliensis GHG001]